MKKEPVIVKIEVRQVVKVPCKRGQCDTRRYVQGSRSVRVYGESVENVFALIEEVLETAELRTAASKRKQSE